MKPFLPSFQAPVSHLTNVNLFYMPELFVSLTSWLCFQDMQQEWQAISVIYSGNSFLAFILHVSSGWTLNFQTTATAINRVVINWQWVEDLLSRRARWLSPLSFPNATWGESAPSVPKHWDRGRTLPELSWENPIHLYSPSPQNYPCTLGQGYLRIQVRLGLQQPWKPDSTAGLLSGAVTWQHHEKQLWQLWHAATSRKKKNGKRWKLSMLQELSQDSVWQAGWGGTCTTQASHSHHRRAEGQFK